MKHWENIERLATRNEGKLPKYAWPGGYPVFYLDSKDNVLCADCANEVYKDPDTDTQLALHDCNWEDPQQYCDECSGLIESAYADDNEVAADESDVD